MPYHTVPERQKLAAVRRSLKSVSSENWPKYPFSSSIGLRALASNTLVFGTGSDMRLKRLGSKCSTDWSIGTHSLLATASDEKKVTAKKWTFFNRDQHGFSKNIHFHDSKEVTSGFFGLRSMCVNF